MPTFAHAATSGVVVFRNACNQIVDPVTNKVGCWEQTTPPTLKYWDGITWVPMTGPAAAVTAVNGLVGAVSVLGTAGQILATTGAPNITLSLVNTAVTPGAYGSATNVATFTVDAKGRITAAANVPITAGVTSIAGTANQITASAAVGAVTLSLPSAVVAPGSVTATTFVQGAIRDTGGQVINVINNYGGAATGLVADGVTDNSPAFQALINLHGANAGVTFLFPRESDCYVFDSILTFSGYGTKVISDAVVRAGNVTLFPCLRFTGAGAGAFIHLDGARGFELGGFNVQYTNAAYTGHLIDVRQTLGTSTDWVRLRDLAIGGNGATGATALVRIEDALTVEIERVTFHDAARSVLGTTAAFANKVTIKDSFFFPSASGGVCHVVAGGQNWTLIGNTFEPINVLAAGSVCVTTRGVEGLTLIGNWTGDSTSGTHVDLTAGPVQGVVSAGNTWQGVTATVGWQLGATRGVHFAGDVFLISGTDIDFGTSVDVSGERSNSYTKGPGLGTNPVFVGTPSESSDYRRGSTWQRNVFRAAGDPTTSATLAIGIENTSALPWLGVNAIQAAGNVQNYATSVTTPTYRWSQPNTATGALNLQVAAAGTAGNPIAWTTAVSVLTSGNVGIGGAPTRRLSVVDAASPTPLSLDGSGNAFTHYLGLGVSRAFAGYAVNNNRWAVLESTGTSEYFSADLTTGNVRWAGTQAIWQDNGGVITGTLVWAPTGSAKTITLPNGTTDFTATGGASQVLRQSSVGAAFTVSQLVSTDLSDTAGLVRTTRLINTTSPITGGGDLSADRTIACATCGVTGSPLSQFAATTSAQLAGVISDETGTDKLVFSDSPTLVTPTLGVATGTRLGLGQAAGATSPLEVTSTDNTAPAATLTKSGTGNNLLILNNSHATTGNPGLQFQTAGTAKFQFSYSRSGAAGVLGNLAYSTSDFQLFFTDAGALIFKDPASASAVRWTAPAAGGFNIGATTASMATGELGFTKITASGSAPGAGTCKEAWVAGTGAGTCKKIAYCGTSGTAVTIVDNVGAGC